MGLVLVQVVHRVAAIEAIKEKGKGKAVNLSILANPQPIV